MCVCVCVCLKPSHIYEYIKHINFTKYIYLWHIYLKEQKFHAGNKGLFSVQAVFDIKIIHSFFPQIFMESPPCHRCYSRLRQLLPS